ncbi:class F sortase [Streptomyces sp. P9-A2]|uniref:class F sortase n=1 Tax=Streptomyces sp. P9-A2 TaxID=3072284 RepID=UPI002FCC8D99
MRRMNTRTAVAVLLVTHAALLTACAPATTPSSSTTSTSSASATEAGRNGVSPSESADVTTTSGVPVRVSIPSLDVDSSLLSLGLNPDGTVEVPPAEKGMTAGWYTGGAVPGEPGAAVIIGHNETRHGRAVFHDLHTVRPGTGIAVRLDGGTTRHFTVTAKEAVDKKAFPTEKVYGVTDDRVLRLITCDGAYDAQGHTVDNLIVYATLEHG